MKFLTCFACPLIPILRNHLVPLSVLKPSYTLNTSSFSLLNLFTRKQAYYFSPHNPYGYTNIRCVLPFRAFYNPKCFINVYLIPYSSGEKESISFNPTWMRLCIRLEINPALNTFSEL